MQWSFINLGMILDQFVGHTKRVCNLYVVDNILVSGSYDSTIRTWKINSDGFFDTVSTSEAEFVYKTSGPVSCIRPG